MNNTEKQAFLSELNNEALIANGFDEALIGYTSNSCEPIRAIYDTEMCIAILVKNHKMEEEDAWEFFEFNVAGSFAGKHGPLFIQKFEAEDVLE